MLVDHGTRPALAGAKSLAGAQAFGVLLPDHHEASSAVAVDLQPVGVSPSRGEPFRFCPDDVVKAATYGGNAIRINFQQRAACAPNAGVGNLAYFGEALQRVIDGTL